MSSPAAPLSGDSAQFAFSTADFERVRKLIHQYAGISLNAGKQAMVYSRRSRRLRDTGHRSFATYLEWLERQAVGDAEWQAFVNCLTTNLTAFFCKDHHFTALAQDLTQHRARPLRIWCNAASTGAKPYSIAMTVAETLGADASVAVLATDIDTHVLESAQRGIYDAGARGLGAQRLKRHFLRGAGRKAGAIRVKPELASMITFAPFNLMSPQWALGEPFDCVLCSNVMIYFDAATQRRVLERIHGTMRAGGLLYVGHSENFGDSRDLFRLHGKTTDERA